MLARTMRRMPRRWRSAPPAETVLSRDLYRAYLDLVSSDPQPHPRDRSVASAAAAAAAAADAHYRSAPSVFDNPEFVREIALRADPVAAFLGPRFALLLPERMQVICGLMELPPSVTGYRPDATAAASAAPLAAALPAQIYLGDQFRTLGRRAFELELALATTFSGRHLLLLTPDLQQSLGAFSDVSRTVVPFMRRNVLYDCVIPFTGTSRAPAAAAEARQRQIKDASAVASFYTMVGLLCFKYGASVRKHVILDRVIMGPAGIVQIVSEAIAR
jgi:hypothetical protein